MNANYRGMNQYPEEYSGYGQAGNNMQAISYHQSGYDSANMQAMMNTMGGGGGGGYPVSGYDGSQSHMMMGAQAQMSSHSAMYQQQSQQAYMAQQQQQQYYSSGGGSTATQFAGQAYGMQGGGNMQGMSGNMSSSMSSNSQYYNASSSQANSGSSTKMVPPPHHHLRNTSGQQNPQQVADNILQMASAFPSHHTVQVPLKNRHAPYQIPRSPQNYYPEKSSNQQPQAGNMGQNMGNPQSGQQMMSAGQLQASTSQAQGQMVAASGMGQMGAVMYSGSSPHSQMPPSSSPMSPMMMASPAAAHQTQGLASPGAMPSPSAATVCSPVPSSPGMTTMRSPCPVPMRSPGHMPSGYAGQGISSPSQRPFPASDGAVAQHCSPTSMHSPASHGSSPYTPSGMAHHVSSPPQSQVFSGPGQSPYKLDMLMDSGQGPGRQGGQTQRNQGSNPLQSLQKLVMLPETQVVDPKSVVSDGCLQNCDEGSKNSEGPAEQSWEAVDCSAGVSVNNSSPPTSQNPTAGSISQGNISLESVSPVGKVNHQSHSTVLSNVADGDFNPPFVSPNLETDAVTENTTSTTGSLNPLVPKSSSSEKNKATPLPASPPKSACVTVETGPVSPNNDTLSPAKCSPSAAPKTLTSDQDFTAAGSHKEEASSLNSSVSSDKSSCLFSNELETSPVLKEPRTDVPYPEDSSGGSVLGRLETGSTIQTKDGTKGAEEDVEKQEKNTTKTTLKPSPPKTRQSQRLAQAPGTKQKSVSPPSQTVDSTSEGEQESDSLEHSSRLSQIETVEKVKLVNGHGETFVNGFDHSQNENCCKSYDTMKNNVHQKSRQGNSSVSVAEKVTKSKLVKIGKSRCSVPIGGTRMLTAVNGSKDGELHGSGGVELAASDSETEELSEMLTMNLASVSNITSSGLVASAEGNNHLTSDNEEDSFASGLDFGYDSPPLCDTLGDESWKPDTRKAASDNGVDEADGNEKCSDNKEEKAGDLHENGDKGKDSPKESKSGGLKNNDSKSTPHSNSKSTPSPSTRVVTRSSTGKAPKRKIDDAYMTATKRSRKSSGDNSSINVAKRTRRSSGATSKTSDSMSLSMECEEIDSKDGFSDVEVISSDGDNLTGLIKTENNISDTTSQRAEKRNSKKSPVVVLTKPAGQDSIKEAASTDQKTGKKSPQSLHQNSSSYYSVRDEKGKFVSKERASVKVESLSVKVDSDSDNEPLIMVQRRSSREEEQSVPGGSSTLLQIDSERHLVHTETNTVERGSSSVVLCSIPTKSSPFSPTKPVSSRAVSPAGSGSSTPKKRGRPRKAEQSPVSHDHKKTKKGAKSKNKNKSFSMPDSADDSFKNMKLSRTLNHLKTKKKGDNSQTSGPFSPFVRVQGKRAMPGKVSVFNNPPAESKEVKSVNKKKQSSASTAPTVTVQMTNFSSDKTVMLPSTKTTESPWVCALCGKRSSFRFLGDLFGPYFLESHLSALEKSDGVKKEGSAEAASSHSTRRKSLGCRRTSSVDESVSIPQEVWVHEDCAMWSSGVYLVESRLYGLEEALRAATTTVCASCKEKGAMIGCLHKGCNQNFHYMCAVDKMCFLDVENFSMLCPKHKDKRLKNAIASTSKS